MVLLELLGVASSAAAINKWAKKSGMKAYPKLDKAKFDAENAKYGIAHDGFTYEKICMIAARCGIIPKTGVFHENGWKHCIHYVSQYIDDPSDLDAFEEGWRNARQIQLDHKSSEIHNKYERSYQAKCNDDRWGKGDEIVLELKHWHGLPKDQYLERMDRLYNDTILGELCTTKPILRNNPRFENSFIEVWCILGQPGFKQGNYLTIQMVKSLYRDCCAHLGYDARI